MVSLGVVGAACCMRRLSFPFWPTVNVSRKTRTIWIPVCVLVRVGDLHVVLPPISFGSWLVSLPLMCTCVCVLQAAADMSSCDGYVAENQTRMRDGPTALRGGLLPPHVLQVGGTAAGAFDCWVWCFAGRVLCMTYDGTQL